MLYDNYKTSVPARREGTFEFADDNGKPLARLNYTRGVLNGEGMYYNSYGRVYRKAVFRMDSLVSLVSLVDSSGLDLIAAAQAKIDEANRLRPAVAPRSRDEEPTPKPAFYRVDVRSGVIYSPDGHKLFTGKWKLTGAVPHRHNRPDRPSDAPNAYNPNQAMYQLPLDIQADGACAWWYPNGVKRADLHYKQGILNGRVVFYDDQGNKELETVYKDGFPDGPVLTYHRNGKTALKGIYEPFRLSELDSTLLNNYHKRLYIRYPIQGISALNSEAEAIRSHVTQTISATLYGKKNGPFYYYDSLGKTVLLVPYVHGVLDGDLIRYERSEAGVSIRTFRYQADSLVAAYNSLGNDLVEAARRQEDSAKNHRPAPGDPANRRERVFTFVEQMPEFKGDVSRYIRAHLKLPPEVLDYSVTGRVIVQFAVNADGRTSDITVVKSLSKACDEEAIRLVRDMPLWQPGRQNGKPVDVWFTLPMLFDPEYTEPAGNGKKD